MNDTLFAFPQKYIDDFGNVENVTGLLIRDYFADTVLQGMFASDTEDWCSPRDQFNSRAKDCYIMADAMLKAREA